MGEEKLLDIKNLSIKTGSGRVLVNNISLDMEKGELLGVVGESGSGKTLTAKTIINLLPENLSWDAERFQVLGVDYLKAGPKAIKSLVGERIGYVPQNTGFYLHPMIKIKDQIADGYVLYSKSSMEEALARASKLVGAVGIKDTERLLNSYPWQLSGGMRQRVNIAMAMMNKPRLIIADEPTTALDSTIQKQVVDLFRAVNEAHQTSVLMISHDLGLIKYYCQRILVMYGGQIMEEAAVGDLFAMPKHPYTKMLIKVIPSLNIKRGARLEEIPGHVLERGKPRSGCVFKERCSYRQDICATEVKEQSLDGFHTFRCNFDI